MRAKDAVGRYGEKVAATYLVEAGWVVLDRNWRGTRVSSTWSPATATCWWRSRSRPGEGPASDTLPRP